MSIGKYVASPAIIGAALGATTTARKASAMPRDWRRYVVWGIWAAGLALAIAGVAMRDRDAEDEVDSRGRR